MPTKRKLSPTPLGQRLRGLRQAQGLTQRALARACGVSHGCVANLERGYRRAPDYRTLRALAGALGVTVEELAG